MQASKIVVGKQYAVRVRGEEPVAFTVSEVISKRTNVTTSHVVGHYGGLQADGTRQVATVPVEAIVGELESVRALAEAKAKEEAAIKAKKDAEEAKVFRACELLATAIGASAIASRYGSQYAKANSEPCVYPDYSGVRVNELALDGLINFLEARG